MPSIISNLCNSAISALRANAVVLLFLCLLLGVNSLWAGTPKAGGGYELLKSIPLTANLMTTDFLKNVYVVDEQNKLTKYDSLGNVVASYSDSKYGRLTAVDASSPLNVLLFYKYYNTIVTTDMKLNVKRLFKLSSLANNPINNAPVACMSYDNYIWVYDADASRLKKIDHNYQVIYQSLDLRNILGEAVSPSFLLERDGLIYMNIPKMGIVMFDIYGTYYSSVSNTDLNKDDLAVFQVVQQKIVYFADKSLFVYDILDRMPEAVNLPVATSPKDVKVEKGRIYVLTDDKLMIYSQKNN